MSKKHLQVLIVFTVVAMGLCNEKASAQKSLALEQKITQFQKEVKVLTEKVKILEARIAGLEVLNAFPSTEKLRAGMIQANKDAMTNDLNNLAANAYQYKIRPATMGGGQGSYANYKIPKSIVKTDNGMYEAVITSDSTVVLTATSAINLGTVQAVVNKIGRLGSFTYTGELE